MSDLQVLGLVLLAVYLWECLLWMPSRGAVCVSWFGRVWRMRFPRDGLAFRGGAVRLAPLLPSLGGVLMARFPSVRLSPQGVCFEGKGSGGRAEWRFVKYAAIRTLRVSGRQLRVNDRAIRLALGPALARVWKRRIEEVKRLAEGDRSAFLRELARRPFETSEIRRRWMEWTERAKGLRVLAAAVFGVLFGAAPAAIWWWGIKPSWLPLLVALGVVDSLVAWQVRSLHRKFYPDEEEDRFTVSLTVLLSPPSAARAMDVLTLPLLAEFHPLAVCQVFCREAEFLRLARRELREVRHRLAWISERGDGPVGETVRFIENAEREAVEWFLEREGLDLKKLAQPPAPLDSSCVAFCPRCESQFTTEAAVCRDCGGLAVERLPGDRSGTAVGPVGERW